MPLNDAASLVWTSPITRQCNSIHLIVLYSIFLSSLRSQSLNRYPHQKLHLCTERPCGFSGFQCKLNKLFIRYSTYAGKAFHFNSNRKIFTFLTSSMMKCLFEFKIIVHIFSFSFHSHDFLNYKIRQLPESLTYWLLLFKYYLLLQRQQ